MKRVSLAWKHFILTAAQLLKMQKKKKILKISNYSLTYNFEYHFIIKVFIMTVAHNMRFHLLESLLEFRGNHHMNVGETCYKNVAVLEIIRSICKYQNQYTSVCQKFCNMLVDVSYLLDHLKNKRTHLYFRSGKHSNPLRKLNCPDDQTRRHLM